MKKLSVGTYADLFPTTGTVGVLHSEMAVLDVNDVEDCNLINEIIPPIAAGLVLPPDTDILLKELVFSKVDVRNLQLTPTFERRIAGTVSRVIYAVLAFNGKEIKGRFSDLTEVPNLRDVPKVYLDANPKLVAHQTAYDAEASEKESLTYFIMPSNRADAAKALVGKTFRIAAQFSKVPREITRKATATAPEIKGEIKVPIFYFKKKMA